MPVCSENLLFDYTKPDIGKTVTAIIAAGGSSSRMKGQNKLFASVFGVPVIARTLTAFQNCDVINRIVISARQEDICEIQKICSEYNITKLTDIVCGGKTRQQSIINAVNAADNSDYFAVHDAARPFVSDDVIRRTLECALRFSAAAPAVPLKDTVKQIGDDGKIIGTPERTTLRAVQTPQIFKADIYMKAVKKAAESGREFTDDCGMVEDIGTSPVLVEGSYFNIKITTPEDIAIAEAIYLFQDRGDAT